MAESEAFDRLCEFLERETEFDRLEARGTVRLALKSAGFDARSVSPEQLGVVAEKLLPGELEARGIQNPAQVCARGIAELRTLSPSDQDSNSPEAIFRRLGGD